MTKYFLEWIRKIIKEKDFTQNKYEEGYLCALEQVETMVQFGTFDDIIYVKLKSKYNIEGLNHNKEYECYSVFGGEYFEIINEEGDLRYFERNKFDVLKIYNPYKKQYVTKDYIDKINLE